LPRRRWIAHAIEVALKGVDVCGPEAAKGLKPGVDFLERFGPEPVQTALRVHGGFNEAGITKYAKVPGNGGLRQAEPAFDLAHGVLGGEKEAEDRPTVRLRQNLEHGFHVLYIPCLAYARQDILRTTAASARHVSGHNGP
jgi:hypothetical protein